MGTKITVENFTEDDTLIVNNETISGEGEAPPAPPTDPAKYNYFGDFMQEKFGKSLTFRDGLRTVYGTGATLDRAAGDRDRIIVPTGEDLSTRKLRLENGGNKSTGKVRVKVDGVTIADGEATAPGSMTLCSDLAAYEGKTLDVIWRDGCADVTKLGYSCYNASNG